MSDHGADAAQGPIDQRRFTHGLEEVGGRNRIQELASLVPATAK